MQECNIKALNTSYTKRKGKLWTHTSPVGTRTQIDYILINSQRKNSALNCEAYNTFCTVGSDHRIITAKIRLRLCQSKTSSKNTLKELIFAGTKFRGCVASFLNFAGIKFR